MNRIASTSLLFAAILITSGCATSRGVLDIPLEQAVNPASGKAIKFMRISDNREFQIDPKQADIPSLKNKEITDSAITSRAIARKRNSYGKALGDILLPEDQTVAGLVEHSLARGFQKNGYRVITPDDAEYDTAIPVEVDIRQFWGWFSPGFWQIKLNYKTLISLSAPIGPFVNGKEIGSTVERGFQTAGTGNWLKTIQAGLDELNKTLTANLKTN